MDEEEARTIFRVGTMALVEEICNDSIVDYDEC